MSASRPNGLFHGIPHLAGTDVLEPYAIRRFPTAGSSQARRAMTEIWHCEPPHAGITYHVTADTWNDDHTERTIHTIEIVEPHHVPQGSL